jgi:SET domain-containing protein
METPPIGKVLANEKLQQRGLYSNKSYKKQDVLTGFYAREILSVPNYLTVQVNENEHILLAPEYLQYINHSCSPNVFFNTTSFQLEALEDIAEGEELTFFYASTEWKMDQSFTCSCGSENCLKIMQGAYYLAQDLIVQYRFTDFIQGKLQQRRLKKRA